MYGAILGDIIGSPYEFDWQNIKTKDFPLFRFDSEFTDDSVMTIAVANALMKMIDMNIVDPWSHHEFEGDDEERQLEIEFIITQSLKKWGNRYPDAGYGARFIKWLRSGTGPYNSYGNGSAMRVSSAGWLYDDFAETRLMARYTALVTHDHPEGIKGAEAIAAAIFTARKGWTKEQIRNLIACEYQYDLSKTCDEIRPDYHHVETCQATIPPAVTAFLEGNSFEDVIRTAVSLGGDCDTLTCIAGSIAEAFYGVPDELKEECRRRITPEMREVLDRFDKMRK